MPVLIVWILLTIFGVLAMYSVSIYESFLLTVRMEDMEPSNYFYFFRQMQSLLIGLLIALIVYKIPLKLIQDHRNKIFLGTLILQLLVFTPLGLELLGSQRYLDLPLIWTLQPSEIFKMGFVVFFAGWFLRKKKMLSTFAWFFGFLILLWILSLIYLALPDLGTLMVLAPVWLIMYWYAGGLFKFVVGISVAGLFIGYFIWMQFDYIRERFEYFVDPEVDEQARGIWWQIQQSVTSVWAGWFLGSGYGKWLQKFWYIPEAQSDFIFAAFSEEIGFIWNSVLLTLYFLLAYFFLINLKYVKNEYYKLLWIWIISLIMVQTFVNIWVNINILPITWITLPFVSYWWTALMINFIQVVLLYKIITEWAAEGAKK